MELSESVIEGLKVAGSSSISDQLFTSFLSRATKLSKTSVDEVESAAAKEAYAGVAVLLYEAARADADSASLNSVLEECQFAPSRSKQVVDFLADRKAELRSLLDRVGHCVPRVVDVHWRLDYYIKGNRLERVNQPEYLIALSTQQQSHYRQDLLPAAPDVVKHQFPVLWEDEAGDSDTKNIHFACSQEQLQDLVFKLKDATKSLDKFTSH